MTAQRRSRHARLSASLSAHSDAELTDRLAEGELVNVGVGGSATVIDVDGIQVFTKRIPLSDREMAQRESTANLFDLPLHCQYGIGGPSFNAWRELAANRIATAAVLAGATQHFPLLYHWRLLPGRPPIAAEHADIDAVVAASRGSDAVRDRLTALARAGHSLVLCGEYLALPLAQLLRANPAGKAVLLEQQLAEVLTALRDLELLHMDGHFENIRSDGERIYLADFGLVTSPRFDLSVAEREFVARHVDHDADYAAMRLVNWVVSEVCGVGDSAGARNRFVRCCAAGDIPDDIPATAAAILTRHAGAAAAMNDFLWRLFDGELEADYRAATESRVSGWPAAPRW